MYIIPIIIAFLVGRTQDTINIMSMCHLSDKNLVTGIG